MTRADVYDGEVEGGGFNDATAGVAYEDGSDVEETNVVEVREGGIDSKVREEGAIGFNRRDYFLSTCISVRVKHNNLGGGERTESFKGLDDVGEGEVGGGGDGMLDDYEDGRGEVDAVFPTNYVG